MVDLVATEVALRSPAEALRLITVPTVVMHGGRDTLIDPSGGRRTAEVISGARYVEIEGMATTTRRPCGTSG